MRAIATGGDGWLRRIAAALTVAGVCGGCGSNSATPNASLNQSPAAQPPAAQSATTDRSAVSRFAPPPGAEQPKPETPPATLPGFAANPDLGIAAAADQPPGADASTTNATAASESRHDGTLEALATRDGKAVEFDTTANIFVAEIAPLPKVDEDRVKAHRIRRVEGSRLVLYTDLPPAAAVDELPAVFEQALPGWCDYFAVDAERARPWRMVGCVMLDAEKFRAAGLLPESLPKFLNGYQLGAQLWVHEQPSDYYRRHLVLHEGTHGFMKAFLGGAGPPWYMEGLAELLATHAWRDGKLTLNQFPRSKAETEQWGRIKIVQQEFADGGGKTLAEILQYGATAHLELSPYAWSWSAAVFLDHHPAYGQRLRNMQRFAPDTSLAFSQRLYDDLLPERTRWEHEWRLFVSNLDYGYDIAREAIVFQDIMPLPAEGREVRIAADRGWQSTGVRVEAGQSYQVEAAGQFQIAVRAKPWISDAGGVTIEYHRGVPIGTLLAAVVDDREPPAGLTPFARPDLIGRGGQFPATETGTLFLRIHDSPAALGDNQGQVVVKIRPAG